MLALAENLLCSIHNKLQASLYLVHFSYDLVTFTYASDILITQARTETIIVLQFITEAREITGMIADATILTKQQA